MEDVKRQAKEIVNCDQLWSRLSVDAKLNTLRISMGLPKRCESTPISSETPEYKSLVEREDEARWWEERRKKSDALLQEMGQIIEAMKTTQNQVNERTLYVKVYLEEYLISCDILNQVFSSVGDLEAIEKFDDGAEFHSRIRFQNRDSALKAFNWFNGRCIYDGCCRMELILGSRTDSRFNGIEAPIEGASSDRLNEIEASIDDANSIEAVNQVEEMENSDDKLEQPTEPMRSLLSEDRSALSTDQEQNSFNWEIAPMVQIQSCAHKVFDGMTTKETVKHSDLEIVLGVSLGNETQECPNNHKEVVKSSNPSPENGDRDSSKQNDFKGGMSYSSVLDFPILECEEPAIGHFEELGNFDVYRIETSGKYMNDWASDQLMKLTEFDVIPSAHQVFEEMSSVEIGKHSGLNHKSLKEDRVFDPGQTKTRDDIRRSSFAWNLARCDDISNYMTANGEPVFMPFDRGKSESQLKKCDVFCKKFTEVSEAHFAELGLMHVQCCTIDSRGMIYVFDPGGRIELPLLTLNTIVITVFDPGIVHKLDLQAVLIDGCSVLGGLILVFDPGGIGYLLQVLLVSIRTIWAATCGYRRCLSATVARIVNWHFGFYGINGHGRYLRFRSLEVKEEMALKSVSDKAQLHQQHKNSLLTWLENLQSNFSLFLKSQIAAL